MTKQSNKREVVVLGKNQGKQAWWVVEVSATKEPILLHHIKTRDNLELDEYGTVVRSGWGDPPEDVN